MERLKFRAWYRNQMYEVYELNITGGMVAISLPRFPFIQDVVPDVVMQFTGLLDKSGKEIYERDIVKGYGYEVRNGHQIRPERIFAINDFIKDTYRLLCITEGTGETVEVIGNIYENPDLL